MNDVNRTLNNLFRRVRIVFGLAMLLAASAAMAQSMAPGTTIRVLPPDGLVIDGNGQTVGGLIEVRDAAGRPLANVALTRSRITSTGAVQGTAGGLLTNTIGQFSQGTLSWGSAAQDLEGGSNRYCLLNVPAAEATLACVDVTVLGTVITTVQGNKAYTLGAATLGAEVAAATRASTLTVMQGLQVQLGHAQSRLRTLRLGGHAAWVNDSTLLINGRIVPLASSDTAAPAEAGPEATRSEGWGAYVMGSLSVLETRDAGALKVQTDGVTVGADYRLNRRAALGAALGQARSDSDVSGVSGAQKSNGTSLTVYGSYEPAPRWFIEAALSVARNSFSLRRGISAGEFAQADTHGTGTGLSVTTGYQMLGRAIVFSPYARLEVLKVDIDGYTESGSSAFSVGEQSLRATSAALGSEVQFVIPTRYAIVVPHGRVEFQRQKQRNGNAATATLVGSQAQLQVDPALESDGSFGLWSLGASAQFKRGVAAFIEWEQLFGKSDVAQRRVSLGVKLEF